MFFSNRFSRKKKSRFKNGDLYVIYWNWDLGCPSILDAWRTSCWWNFFFFFALWEIQISISMSSIGWYGSEDSCLLQARILNSTEHTYQLDCTLAGLWKSKNRIHFFFFWLFFDCFLTVFFVFEPVLLTVWQNQIVNQFREIFVWLNLMPKFDW